MQISGKQCMRMGRLTLSQNWKSLWKSAPKVNTGWNCWLRAVIEVTMLSWNSAGKSNGYWFLLSTPLRATRNNPHQKWTQRPTKKDIRKDVLFRWRNSAGQIVEDSASKVLERHKLIGIPEMDCRFFAFITWESYRNIPKLRNYFALYFRFVVC